jgi:hypothetical protein
MAQRRNALITLAAIAVAGVTIFAPIAISKAPTLPNGYGSLSYKVRAKLNEHRLLFEKVHDSHGRWLGTTRSTVGRGSSRPISATAASAGAFIQFWLAPSSTSALTDSGSRKASGREACSGSTASVRARLR